MVRTDQGVMHMWDHMMAERDKKYHVYSVYEPPLIIESDDKKCQTPNSWWHESQ